MSAGHNVDLIVEWNPKTSLVLQPHKKQSAPRHVFKIQKHTYRGDIGLDTCPLLPTQGARHRRDDHGAPAVPLGARRRRQLHRTAALPLIGHLLKNSFGMRKARFLFVPLRLTLWAIIKYLLPVELLAWFHWLTTFWDRPSCSMFAYFIPHFPQAYFTE